MTLPELADWSFADIERDCDARAKYLKAASPEQLLRAVVFAFRTALASRELRFAVDSIENQFQVCRAYCQFPALPHIVDQFYNARAGYRAHFWASPAIGLEFNASLVRSLTMQLEQTLSESVSARKILVDPESQNRKETDGGSMSVPKKWMLQSLDPTVSKAWLCERLVQADGSDPEDTGILFLSVRSPKLHIPKWEAATGPSGEGLRAPLPTPDQAWLDVKGGFVDRERVFQLKDPLKRATDLHRTGWT